MRFDKTITIGNLLTISVLVATMGVFLYTINFSTMQNTKDIGRIDRTLESINNKLSSLDTRVSSIEGYLRGRSEQPAAFEY